MYNQNSHIANNAKGALQNHLREQEDRKKAMQREQQTRELRQYETNLFHKQQEIQRIKTQMDRLKREAVVIESKTRDSIEKLKRTNTIKDLENKITLVDKSVQSEISQISQKIELKKKEIELLEKQKREVEANALQQKNNLNSDVRRSRATVELEERRQKEEARLFESTKKQIQGFEQSLRTFTQESLVLENKIKALKTSLR